MLKHLESVGIQVTDQDRALDFYVNKLGFEKIKFYLSDLQTAGTKIYARSAAVPHDP